MLVRMAHWKCRPDCWGEDHALFEGGAVPIMQGHAGFVRAMLLGRPDAVERIAFTVWQDRAAYERFCASPDLARITEMFAHMYVEGEHPKPDEFIVRAQGAAKSGT